MRPLEQVTAPIQALSVQVEPIHNQHWRSTHGHQTKHCRHLHQVKKVDATHRTARRVVHTRPIGSQSLLLRHCHRLSDCERSVLLDLEAGPTLVVSSGRRQPEADLDDVNHVGELILVGKEGDLVEGVVGWQRRSFD